MRLFSWEDLATGPSIWLRPNQDDNSFAPRLVWRPPKDGASPLREQLRIDLGGLLHHCFGGERFCGAALSCLSHGLCFGGIDEQRGDGLGELPNIFRGDHKTGYVVLNGLSI